MGVAVGVPQRTPVFLTDPLYRRRPGRNGLYPAGRRSKPLLVDRPTPRQNHLRRPPMGAHQRT